MGGTPQAYIPEKKKAEEALDKNQDLQKENEDLRIIIRKLLNDEPLEESDNIMLERLGISKIEDPDR